jgi:2-polyprenyl-6-methoxyphenol hydroxylase-like FAD-dependent oxidoreductase
MQPPPPQQHQATHILDVLVVGAGLAGLASAVSTALSGHRVTVVESAKELLEVCYFLHCLHGEASDQPIDLT